VLEKIEGTIIKTQDYGESNKIVTLFSQKIGKFSAIARGAKKPKSRMAAVTQPFIHGNYLVYVSTGLSTIQQGEIIDSYRNIREDIVKMAFAAYISEFTDKVLESYQPDFFLFDQFFRTMNWISDKNEYMIPVMMFELKLFEKAGIAPTLDQCVLCGNNEELSSFSIVEGGLLCKNCFSFDRYSIVLPSVVAKLLYIFSTIGLDQVGTISVKQKNQILLRKILDTYYDQYGGYYLKSRKFLNQIDLLK